MQRVRRALRKSPEAAKALVNKMWDRSHQRRRVQDRPPSTYATRAEQLAEAKRVAREPQDRREGQRRMALWHLLSHEERQRTPFPFDISSADPNATWRELSSLEQREAIDASTPGSTPGTRSWESMGLQRAATRSSNPLCTLDTEVGTIPGTTGDVGLPGAWCSLHAVHQYKLRKLELNPLGLSPSSSSQDGTTLKKTSLPRETDVPIALEDSEITSCPSNSTQQMVMNEIITEAAAEESSPSSSFFFTQQMAIAGAHEAGDELHPCESPPIIGDSAMEKGDLLPAHFVSRNR
ncbi:hypothetical protein CYMTET_13461 [Cymbomonas tetramitiformis]|uniref:Uncharacterized protein n=1 Tax=Cymbomonas tetramitiformis TaxID=36881 RepID=A0AAE0GID7_9CHLO|nr:hypothetical protein CYMTET_13461 [Cymbomonas tetramitiformis]